MSSIKYRHLSRNSAHRKALLRNLVTSLIEKESIQTSWAKAKEAQRLAEKLITWGKKNTNATRAQAQAVLFTPERHLPKLFGELRERYANRFGGYTRVLRCEPLKEDQAQSAILSLVDGPKDMRFAMTAKAIVRQRAEDLPMHELTAVNIRKTTRYRKNGMEELESEVRRLEANQRKVREKEEADLENEGATYEWRRKEEKGPGMLERKKIENPNFQKPRK